MEHAQENFVLNINNDESPIIITVPHGGMNNSYGSWLESLFQKRTKSDNPEENIIQGEKIVLGGDNQIMHVVADVLREYQANVIIGLLPRTFIDYNRFVPEVAYVDKGLKPFYESYHQTISETIERLKKKWGLVFLFDFHGFGKQPIEGKEFDIILGTNGESSPYKTDRFFFNSLKNEYQIFCAGADGMSIIETNLYKGDTTNLFYYKKYGIDALLVEISSKFRSSKNTNSKELGKKLAKDLGLFFNRLDKKAKEIQMDINGLSSSGSNLYLLKDF